MLSDEELEALRGYLQSNIKRLQIRPVKIKAIHVNSSFHWQPPLYIEVGDICAGLEKDSPPEKIIAIFEAASFLVITPERGYFKNLPYFFSRQDVRQVIRAD